MAQMAVVGTDHQMRGKSLIPCRSETLNQQVLGGFSGDKWRFMPRSEHTAFGPYEITLPLAAGGTSGSD
jgi:hypothetical protein